jgi:hypothetical protein
MTTKKRAIGFQRFMAAIDSCVIAKVHVAKGKQGTRQQNCTGRFQSTCRSGARRQRGIAKSI